MIGYLSAGTAASDGPYLTAFRQGLDQGGYVEGRNVEILFRYAEFQHDRLPSLAADLVRHGVAVIVAAGGAPALAAKEATATIPIVFVTGVDPVAIDLVPRLNRPGGNPTGASFLYDAYFAKGIEFMHELVPEAGNTATRRKACADRPSGRATSISWTRHRKDASKCAYSSRTELISSRYCFYRYLLGARR